MDNYFKIKISMYLMIIGDIIGYDIILNNIDIESIKNKLNLEKNYDSTAIYYTRLININFFYNNYGFNNYDISNKKVSYNSLYYISFIEAFIDNTNNLKNINDIKINKLKKSFINNIKKYNKEYDIEKLLYVINDVKYKNNEIEINKNILNNKYINNKITKNNSNISLFYSIFIGIIYYDNINMLIKLCIHMTKLINNNAYCYIGSIIIALFVSYIILGIKIDKWIFEILDLIKNTDKIEKILKEILDEENVNKDEYINILVNYKDNLNIIILKIEKYIKFRFNEKKNYAINNIEFM